MMSKGKEKILLYSVQAKQDPDAFATLYDEYIQKIYRFVLLKVTHPTEAEDITSDVFLKVWQYLIDTKKTKTISSFSGLVYTIARNAVIDHYRAKSKQDGQTCWIDTANPERQSYFVDNTSAERMQNRTDATFLLNTLRTMKQEYQDIIVMRYFDQLSMAEIAEILGKSSINVRVTLHRAMRALKRMSEDNERPRISDNK